jgi:hypothetical protein
LREAIPGPCSHGRISMPINAPRRLVGRRQVAWFGCQPPQDGQTAFKDRGFLVTSCTDSQLTEPAFLAGLSAVIFTQRADKPTQIVQSLRDHAKRLLNHDCQIILRPRSKELSQDPSILRNVLDGLRLPRTGLPHKDAGKTASELAVDAIPPLPHVAFFDESVSWGFIANVVADNALGAAPNLALKITVDDVVTKLDPDAELLIRRAFWDCSDVHLVAMEGGRSGVRVYRGYAELAGGLHAQWPQPHFVKLGDRTKILEEYEIYEENVDPYIPFHLGPHLIRERCCLGASEGVLVGDYVEESESLRDCASEGRAATAIACLFDRTLLGWHRRWEEVSTPLSRGLLHRFPRMSRISNGRYARARALGATRDLNELRTLFERCNSEPILVGPIHGDLHAANVRVRATDAIVIDFCAHVDFPLVYDAACLEASLLVEGFADDKREIEDWLSSIAQLYEHPVTDGSLPHPNPKDRSCWFHACVRQIRRYARQWERGKDQYAGALAVALLTKAVKDKNAPEPEASRRAAAYVLAERVLWSTFGPQDGS